MMCACAIVPGVIAAALGVVSSLHAQTIDRSVRPRVVPPAPYVFPPVVTRTLGNGIRVVIVENHETPVVAVRVVIDSGPLVDPRGKEGLLSVMLALLGEGTTTMSGDQLADSAADMGTAVAPTGFTTLRRNFDRSIALLADMLVHPAFPDAAVARIKVARIASIQLAEHRPDLIPPRLFAAIAFGPEHPYARRPSQASISGITREDVVAIHSAIVRPHNVSVVVVGDVAVGSILPTLERTFGTMPRGGEPVTHSVPPPNEAAARGATTIYLLDNPGDTLAYLYTGELVPGRSSPDYVATEVLNILLAGVSSVGRLHDALRVQNQYAYFVNSGFWWHPAPEPGTFYGASVVHARNAAASIAEWVGVLRAIGTSRPPTAAEMAFAQVNQVASLPMRMETVDAIADVLTDLVQSGLPLDFVTRGAAGTNALTSAEVAAAARKYADPDHTIIIVVGDRSMIEQQLRVADIAPVIIVDASGHHIK